MRIGEDIYCFMHSDLHTEPQKHLVIYENGGIVVKYSI